MLHRKPVTGQRVEPVAARRITVVCDDADFVGVIRDAFATSHVVAGAAARSMTAIAEQEPDVLLITPSQSARASLGDWDIVALARAYNGLRRVPIVLFTPDLDALIADSDQLSVYGDVHVVGMPFDLDVLTGVVAFIERAAQQDLVAVPEIGAIGTASRLPALCPHGYPLGPDAVASRCATCA